MGKELVHVPVVLQVMERLPLRVGAAAMGSAQPYRCAAKEKTMPSVLPLLKAMGQERVCVRGTDRRTDRQTDNPSLSVLSTSSTRYHPQPRAPPMGTTSSPPPPKKKKILQNQQLLFGEVKPTIPQIIKSPQIPPQKKFPPKKPPPQKTPP